MIAPARPRPDHTFETERKHMHGNRIGARREVGLAGLALVLILALGGCETGGQTGALVGTGIGALAGQAIGGDTGATLIGAAAGAGIGYVIGNEQDKKHAREMSEQSASQQYTHHEVSPIGGTRWQVVSLAPRDVVPPYTSKIVEFHPNGRVVTTTTMVDGTVKVSDEKYRVVGSTLIINSPGYLINAEYDIDGNEMIVSAEEFRAVLRRL
jgi:hypothetical protein